MTKFLTLLGREVKAYFYSPIAYVVLFFFLLLTGFNFYTILIILNAGPSESTLVDGFFNTVPFWIAFLLSFPLITMRTFSDEFKTGTIEALMTAPVGDWMVVLSKFAGALFFFSILWIPTLLYFWCFQQVTGHQAGSAPGVYLGSYLMLFLLGMFYISVGCLASVLTKHQIVAAIVTLVAILLLFLFGLVALFLLNFGPAFRDLVGYFSAVEHMMNFSRGVIDSRPIVWYVSMTAFMLFLTQKIFETRKWKV